MVIYVMRHALTDGNIAKLMVGRTDVPINEIGVLQANNAVKEVEKLNYDLIICSPMLRTRQTCEIINSVKQIPILYDDRIIEMNFGVIEKKPISSIDKSYWNYHSNLKYKNSLSTKEHYDIVVDFINNLMKKHNNKNILIVTHNEVCRKIKAYFIGIPKNGNLEPFGQDNCEIKKYETV